MLFEQFFFSKTFLVFSDLIVFLYLPPFLVFFTSFIFRSPVILEIFKIRQLKPYVLKVFLTLPPIYISCGLTSFRLNSSITIFLASLGFLAFLSTALNRSTLSVNFFASVHILLLNLLEKQGLPSPPF